jgi:ParB/RepB/Spo0J family partition protein
MELRTIRVSECFESPTNPRGTKFDKAEFAELVASVKEKGILMPVLVRPHGKQFEVIAGNRRFRAAKEAGLTEIPAQVSDLSDTEAREAQIVENLQRADRRQSLLPPVVIKRCNPPPSVRRYGLSPGFAFSMASAESMSIRPM